MKRYTNVDDYIEGSLWKAELTRLREIMLSTELTEEVKWGAPCYTFEGKNLIGLGSFKSYFGIWFHQGVLLSDPQQVLINAQDGKTKALRQWRFESKKDIKVRLIRSYVKEAIELQKKGLEIKPSRSKSTSVPVELSAALDQDKKAKTAFAELTPGRQREYSEYIEQAKRQDTKQRRITKILPMIAKGIGLNDQYRC
ncbi:MAG: DUF1801 domain-containing protein [Planctomycetota bacterium]